MSYADAPNKPAVFATANLFSHATEPRRPRENKQAKLAKNYRKKSRQILNIQNKFNTLVLTKKFFTFCRFFMRQR